MLIYQRVYSITYPFTLVAKNPTFDIRTPTSPAYIPLYTLHSKHTHTYIYIFKIIYLYCYLKSLHITSYYIYPWLSIICHYYTVTLPALHALHGVAELFGSHPFLPLAVRVADPQRVLRSFRGVVGQHLLHHAIGVPERNAPMGMGRKWANMVISWDLVD